MRFQGEQHAKVLRALGAVPVQVPPGEIADGMSKGVIDGAVFNYEAAESFGLMSVTQHVMEPLFLPSTLVLVMNPAKYDGLPADLRAILDDTTGPAAAEHAGCALGRGAAARAGHDAGGQGRHQHRCRRQRWKSCCGRSLQPLTAEAVAAQDKAGKPGTGSSWRITPNEPPGQDQPRDAGSSIASPPCSWRWRCWPWPPWGQ